MVTVGPRQFSLFADAMSFTGSQSYFITSFPDSMRKERGNGWRKSWLSQMHKIIKESFNASVWVILSTWHPLPQEMKLPDLVVSCEGRISSEESVWNFENKTWEFHARLQKQESRALETTHTRKQKKGRKHSIYCFVNFWWNHVFCQWCTVIINADNLREGRNGIEWRERKREKEKASRTNQRSSDEVYYTL